MHGSELEQMIEASGLKTQTVYERAGLNRSHLYKILQKESVSVEEFVRITKAIGLKPGDLLENSVGQLEPDVIALANELNGMEAPHRTRTVRAVRIMMGVAEEITDTHARAGGSVSTGKVADRRQLTNQILGAPHVRNERHSQGGKG